MASNRTPVNRVVRGNPRMATFLAAYHMSNKAIRGAGSRFKNGANTIVGTKSAPSTTRAQGKPNG